MGLPFIFTTISYCMEYSEFLEKRGQLGDHFNEASPLAALKSHVRIVPASGSAFAATTAAARLLRHPGLPQLSRQSPGTLAFFLIRCIGSPACPILSDAAVDTSSEVTTTDLKEKKEVVEEAENGRDAPADGNANEENGEQEADNEVEEEEEEGGEEEGEEEEGDGEEEDGDEDEEAEAAEEDEDDDVDTKKQKTDEDD
ncbi:prothymosin alpha-like [Suricata suricatta]|uniref:prothymosin alpha-like n=1 Tax=Suricata suricatta TaxID=37032 RepID=UPI001155AD0B|nr:prothymosin alpha-like [Suricata suricatta]